MPATFEKAIKVVLKHEGGYVDHPNDPGGATNFGVSLRYLKTLSLGLADIDGDGDIDADDVRRMTLEDAQRIYKVDWWDKYKYGQLSNQTLATKVFDLAINMGASRSHKLLQAAINTTQRQQLVVDGVIGPKTIQAINNMSDRQLQNVLTAYCNKAWSYYQQLITANAKLAVFKKGWRNRAYSLGHINDVV